MEVDEEAQFSWNTIWRAGPWGIVALSKYLLSFLKNDWVISDYPIRMRHFRSTDVTSFGDGSKPVRWTAQIIGWALIGAGDTKREALNDIGKNFGTYKGKNPLPRPGTQKPITFASTSHIDRHRIILRDFCIKILGFKSMDNLFVSDVTSLYDFQSLDSVDNYINKIRDAYEVDVSDLREKANLLEILERISRPIVDRQS